jgi:ribonuclease HII
MQGRTWKKVNDIMAGDIKEYLLANGGLEEEVRNQYEIWRIKFSDSTFTYYSKGTLFSTPSSSKDPSVFEAWEKIDSFVGQRYIPSAKDFLVGLDETGKGEVIGHTILTGVIFPNELFREIDLLVGPADTKVRHKFEYWDEIFEKLDNLRSIGLNFIVEKIPPWHVDKYNLNKIMDISYQRILSNLLRRATINRCRVVLDDYGVGPTLVRFLNFLEKQGSEILISSNSEDKYLEVKTASLISKRIREGVIKAINEALEFQIKRLSVGSGNAGDKQTLEWLNKWYSLGKEWPWFVKRSYRTIWEIEGRVGKPTKSIPPIREELLSKEFLEQFNEGNLSIQSLSLICPSCSNILSGATFAIFNRGKQKVSELKCPNPDCGNFIKDASITLRYYCGYIIPDSSAIRRNLISNDLTALKFFENFNVILVPVVRKECDSIPAGRKELDELRKFSTIGRIKLETVGRIEDVPDNLSNVVRDEKIIEACLEYNAILLTADKTMATFASGRNVFAIFV